MTAFQVYAAAVAVAAGVTFAVTPLVRWLALRFDWMDAPTSSVKTHKVTTPSLGGAAIYAGFVAALLCMRFWTQFPTGTLRSLRGVLLGGTLMFALGIIDDLKKPKGLGFKPKFAVQAVAAALLIVFGIQIRFITPDYFSIALTFLWVVGITNAYNIIDIMDGLSASQAAIAALSLLLISLPSEEHYVNIASAALAGAALGFLPWNFSKRYKIFMGDAGSLLLGFVLAAMSMGTKFTEVNTVGVFCPLLILLVPMYDTFLVMYLRLRKGQSPFLGSKDHFALRLEKVGYSRASIVLMAAVAAGFLGFCAFLVTLLTWKWALCVYALVLAEILLLSNSLADVVMHD
jgi:UDP-GlcNAc:undecaprenyl-phosphate/decaprenyl-phosphate GlcNAc-1-phosphate transferase